MYEFVKSAHLLAITLWIVNMLIATIALKANGSNNPDLSKKSASLLRFLMTIGIMFTWILGLYMAYQSEYYTAGWFQVKFLIVFVLSAIHGIIAGKLRNNGQISSSLNMAKFISLTVISVCMVVFLVLEKPF